MSNFMTLEEIRDRLDLGDTQMLEWLATRANLVREVARIKQAKNASLQAADREASMFAKKQQQCRVHGLDFDYVSEIVSLMIWHSKQIECDELDRETFLNTEPVPDADLRTQLLELTREEAPRYDEFCRGDNADAVSAYLDRERQWLDKTIAELEDHGLAIDLGCATGQIVEHLCDRFSSVRAYDISPDMIEHAKARRSWPNHVTFEQRDLDEGIPVDDESVSLAVANFGAASELHPGLMSEIARLLRPGGRAFLSFYNSEALVNHWIYPWPATIHSHLNPFNDTLEVWSGDSVYTVRARGVNRDTILAECASAGLTAEICETYPTLQPILPNFIVRNPRAREVYDIGHYLDDFLARPDIGRGTYIMVTLTK